MNNTVTKVAICLALVVIAVVSFFPIADRYTSPDRYTDYAASINEKTETVLKLMAASTVTSAGITAIPGDTATPIAEKLADFSEYFLLILCVLYAEKYLLTIIPYGVFKGLIPLTCALFIAGRIWNPRLLDKQGFKLLLIGLSLLLIIPLSVRTSDMIYTTYKESIDSTLASAEALTDETTELSEAQQDTNMLNRILSRLSETTDGMIEKASNILNRFVETLAVMIVTSCLIPILVLMFFLWVIKQLTGVDLRDYSPRRGRGQSDKGDGHRHEDQEQYTNI